MRGRRFGATLLASVALIAALTGGIGQAVAGGAADSAAPLVTVEGTRFVDSHGREVVLRGFNVSGEVKLAENGQLPFADATDARRSALAMQELTGANTVRFLLCRHPAQWTPPT
jgi:hypothetical protein